MNIKTLTLLLGSLASAQAATIHTGLLNYWALDGNGDDTASSFTEGTSAVADNMNVGGTAGAATILSSGGLFGGAADFERSTANDGYLAAANSADLNFEGENISTSLWVNFDDNASGNWQAILIKGEGSNYRISTNRRSPGSSQASAAFGAGDVNSGVGILTGNWHHIAITADAGAPVQVYVDGALAGTGGNSSIVDEANANEPLNGGGELWIGNNTQNPDRMWDGLIDDVAQWDRSLTADEVQTIYNEGLTGTSLGNIGVPEPSSSLLLGLSSLAFAIRRRR